MSKKMKRIISVILAVCIMSALVCIGYAANEDDKKIQLSICSANVAGLPIPSYFDKDDHTVVPKATKLMGKILNESGADIICTQEDFQYHSILAKEMTAYKYRTYTSGGIPVGDGINIFSKYPIYNIVRVQWEVYCGILKEGNDGLTPKGFMKFTADVDGVLVDIYAVHLDAYGSEKDNIAKAAEFKQLTKYISENSADRAVMITGDFNATFHTDEVAQMYEELVVNAEFIDTWAEVENDGNYFRGEDAQEKINEWYAKFNGLYWGMWDSVERLFYKNGAGVGIEANSIEYIECKDDDMGYLSDHRIMIAGVEISTSDYTRPDIEIESPSRNSAVYSITHSIEMVSRCIYLLISDLFRMLFAGELF